MNGHPSDIMPINATMRYGVTVETPPADDGPAPEWHPVHRGSLPDDMTERVRQGMRDGISLRNIGRSMGFNPTYISNEYRNRTGETASEWCKKNGVVLPRFRKRSAE